MLRLNKVEEEYLKNNLARCTKFLPIWIERYDDPNETLEQRKESVFEVTSKLMSIAYDNYAFENFSEVKPYLEKAAPFAFLRGFDPKLKTGNIDWTIQKELNVVILFGDDELKTKLGQADWSLSKERIMHQACYLYDHLLIKLGSGQSIPEEEIITAITEAKKTKDKDVQQFILPLIEAIEAIIIGDQLQWQANIDKVIQWHTDECKFGELKDMTDGFICLNALTIAKLGKDQHNWQCTTDSLYLPLFLID